MPASDLDYALLYQARKCINGGNVHQLRTAIFCYETSAPNSGPRAIYEKGLRDLVREHYRSAAARTDAESARQKAENVLRASDDLDQRVTAVLGTCEKRS